jgi:hypothetical protein
MTATKLQDKEHHRRDWQRRSVITIQSYLSMANLNRGPAEIASTIRGASRANSSGTLKETVQNEKEKERERGDGVVGI